MPCILQYSQKGEAQVKVNNKDLILLTFYFSQTSPAPGELLSYQLDILECTLSPAGNQPHCYPRTMAMEEISDRCATSSTLAPQLMARLSALVLPLLQIPPLRKQLGPYFL